MNTYVVKVDGEVILRMRASSKRDVPRLDTSTDPQGMLGYAQDLASKGASVRAIASRMGSYHSSLELESGKEPEQEPSAMDKIRSARARLARKAEDTED